MRLARGARLGPYEVSTLLGTGGMAEVYRARDTRLGRDVALKVVSESLGGDRAFRDRFEREARLAGSVNHPNVVALYDVGLENGLPYFVTELLEGSSLRERLAKGPLTLSTALDWAVQIAEGLAAAHERGIIHRDLKPGNVFLTRDGRVKLLDFGIAKLVEAARDEVTHGLMTETVPLAGGQTGTGTGAVLGTPGYMSPEQIRGERVDARTDFFSFGAVLYEMLTGRRAFPASTLVESEHAILHTEPEPLPASLPRQVTQLVQRCLEKEPARRFQSARDLAFNLNLLRLPVDATAPLPARAGPVRRRWRWQRWGGWLALLVSLGAAVGGTFLVTRRLWAPGRAPTIDFVTSQLGDISGARFTPDGRVVLSAAWDGRPSELFVDAPGTFEGQPLGVRDVRLLSVSSKGELAVLLHPVSETVYDHEVGYGTLAIVPAAGGTPRELAVGVSAADWSPTDELAVVRLVEGKRRLEFPMGTAILETTDYLISPRVSPRGDLVAVIHLKLGAPDELLVVDRKGQARKLRTSPLAKTSPEQATPTKLAWLPSGGEVWFTTYDAVWAAPLAGPERLAYQAVSAIHLEDISRSGTVLLTIRNDRDELGFLGPDDPTRERRLSTFGAVAAEGLVALSNDGRKVLFTEQVDGIRAYLRPTDGSPAVRLGRGDALALSPDQRWVLIAPAEHQEFITLLPTGAGQAKRLNLPGMQVRSARWLHDQRRIIVLGRTNSDQRQGLYLISIDGGAPRRIAVPVDSLFFEVSPDERWVAARGAGDVVTLFPVDEGAAVPLPGLGTDALPIGWSSTGDLWVKEARGVPSRLRRFAITRRSVVEERTVGPTDSTGVLSVSRVRITPDGRAVAFQYERSLDTLVLMKDFAQ